MISCRSCEEPVANDATVCHFCGSPRTAFRLEARCSRLRQTTHSFGRSAWVSLVAKIPLIFFASIMAAALLWHHQDGELRLEHFIVKTILRDAQSHFAVAFLVSLIPRWTGLVLALMVLGTRTYMVWQTARGGF